jgi:hypothetical protein
VYAATVLATSTGLSTTILAQSQFNSLGGAVV